MNVIAGREDTLSDAHKSTIAAATRFLETLGKGDMEGLMPLWHENGRLEFPFSPNGHPPVEGIERLRDYFLGTRGRKSPKGFPIKGIYPGSDPDWVVVEFRGDLTNTKTGEDYSNEYIAVMQMVGGKVHLFREYFDSVKRMRYEG